MDQTDFDFARGRGRSVNWPLEARSMEEAGVKPYESSSVSGSRLVARDWRLRARLARVPVGLHGFLADCLRAALQCGHYHEGTITFKSRKSIESQLLVQRNTAAVVCYSKITLIHTPQAESVVLLVKSVVLLVKIEQ